MEFINAVERDDVGQSKSSGSGSSNGITGGKKKGGVGVGVKWTPTKGLRMLMNDHTGSDGHNQNNIPENCTIHPLTAYLIQYCRRLQQYPNASRVLNRRSNSVQAQSPSGPFAGHQEEMDLARIIVRLLNILLKNLKLKVQRLAFIGGKGGSNSQGLPNAVHSVFGGKRHQETDQDKQAFSDMFMLNNGNYMLKSAEQFKYSEAIEDIGFFKEMKENVRRHKNSYLHASWKLSVEWLKMINEQLQRHQHLQGTKEAADSEKHLKQLLRQFQNTWKARYTTQRRWYVPDRELRKSLKLKLEQYILPGFVQCSNALDSFVESTGQAYWKRMFPLYWEEGSVRKQIELALFEGQV